MNDGDANSFWEDKKVKPYQYPETSDGKRLDWKPGSDLHQKMVNEVRERAKACWSYGSSVRKQCKEIGYVLNSFISKHTEDDLAAKDRRPDKPINVMVPFSLASRDHFAAFFMSEFTSPYGNYLLTGKGPDGMYGAAIMETILSSQARQFHHNQNLITFARDCAVFPVACMAPVWSKHTARNTVLAEVTDTVKQLIEGIYPKARVGELLALLDEQVIHEGNRLENIDFNRILLNPESSYADEDSQQKAEYDGNMGRGNGMDFLRREKDPEENLDNMRYLMAWLDSNNGKVTWWDGYGDESGRKDKYGLNDSPSESTTVKSHYFEYSRLFWWLIPKQWDLGEKDAPELWAFTLAADEVLVEHRPLNLYHGKKPWVIACPTNDGYQTYSTSMLALVHGIQEYLNWEVRSMVASTRKSLNGIVLIDETMWSDKTQILNRDETGGIIFAGPSQFGTGDIGAGIKQLTVPLPSENWAQKVSVALGMFNQIFGSLPLSQGDMSGLPDRPTEVGLGMANDAAMSRMGLYAESIREQAYEPLVFQLAMNTIQFLSQELWHPIGGVQSEEYLRDIFGSRVVDGSIPISPKDLSGNFDVRYVSRRKKAMQMQAAQSFAERMFSIPEFLMQAMSDPKSVPGRIFLYITREMGFDNVLTFTQQGPPINTQVVPDQQIMNMGGQGQIVPMGGGGMQ